MLDGSDPAPERDDFRARAVRPLGHVDAASLVFALLLDRFGRQVCFPVINGSDMAFRDLRLSALLELSPSERLNLLKKAARAIDAEIADLQAAKAPIWYGHSRRSRRFRLQSLYARRQQLVALAREAGCGDGIREPVEVA